GASCGSSSSDDEPPRFGDFDGSTTTHPDAGEDEDASCADAFPPCAVIAEGGAGSDLDASAEPAQDGGSSCSYPNTCQQARDLGSLQGDGGSSTKTATGYSSEWL